MTKPRPLEGDRGFLDDLNVVRWGSGAERPGLRLRIDCAEGSASLEAVPR
jgi:hypothetical protein